MPTSEDIAKRYTNRYWEYLDAKYKYDQAYERFSKAETMWYCDTHKRHLYVVSKDNPAEEMCLLCKHRRPLDENQPSSSQ